MTTLTLRPKEKNFKNGTASLSFDELKKLAAGEYDEVVIIDRTTGNRFTFDPSFVSKRCYEHTYTIRGKWGRRYLRKLILFRFDGKASRNETKSVSV